MWTRADPPDFIYSVFTAAIVNQRTPTVGITILKMGKLLALIVF